MTEKRKTVGEASRELSLNGDEKQGVVDTQREMQKGYYDQLIIAINKGKELYGIEKHFYICVHTRRERTMINVIRNQFHPRQTRPIPQYDLALYWYDPKTEQLSFVWCIPDKETVKYYCSLKYASVKEEERELWKFCKGFKAGTLV